MHQCVLYIYIYMCVFSKKKLIARSAALLKLTRFTRTIISHQRAINRVKGNFFFSSCFFSQAAKQLDATKLPVIILYREELSVRRGIEVENELD